MIHFSQFQRKLNGTFHRSSFDYRQISGKVWTSGRSNLETVIRGCILMRTDTLLLSPQDSVAEDSCCQFLAPETAQRRITFQTYVTKCPSSRRIRSKDQFVVFKVDPEFPSNIEKKYRSVNHLRLTCQLSDR